MGQEAAMRALGSISGSAPSRPDATPHRPQNEPREDAEAHGRALVPVGLCAPSTHRPARHPAAPFLAHLIAIDQRVPQTRMRARATPEEAIAAYAAARARASAPVGRILRRSA
jgi:hypothetical protein